MKQLGASHAFTRRRWLASVGAALAAAPLPFGIREEPRTVVAGARVVLPGRFRRADLLLGDGRILAVGGPFEGAHSVIAADGLWVLPGGVDTHVHASTRWRHTAMRSFAELTADAVRGGTTTVIDFVVQQPGEPLTDALDRKRTLARRGSLCDYAFHVLITDPEAAAGGIGPALAAGARSFKLFMASPNALDAAQMEAIMGEVSRHGGLVSVHAEDGAAIARLEAAAANHTLTPADLPRIRPPEVELSAVRQALELARRTGVRLHFHHLSTRASWQAVETARSRGQLVTAETCPHYLVLDDSAYRAPDSWRQVIFPPLRPVAETDGLWEGIAAGAIDTLASDDACFPLEQKRLGARSLELAPPGGCGAADRLRLALAHGHFERGLPLTLIARLTAARPAEIFGLAPVKGTLQVGADADLVLVDPTARRPLERGNAPYSMFDDRPLRGYPVLTMRRGKVLARDGRLAEAPGPGVAL